MPQEFRGIIIPVRIWQNDHIDSMKFNISRIINSVEKANYNAVFLEIRKEAEQIYPPGRYNHSIGLNNSKMEFDPVEWAINEARQKGLKIYALFDLLTIWEGSTPPENPNHLYYAHGPDVLPGDSWALTGEFGSYLNPSLPEVKTFLKKMIRNFVMQYDIDGLLMDFCPFLSSYNTQFIPSQSTIKWDPLTDLVEDVVVEAMLIKPFLVNSSILNAHDLELYPEIFRWLDAGIIDFFIPIVNNVKRENPEDILKIWENLVNKTDHPAKIFAGINSTDEKQDIQSLVNLIQSSGARGNVLFRQISESDTDLIDWPYFHHLGKVPLPESLKGIYAEQVFSFDVSELLSETKVGQQLEVKRFDIVKRTDTKGRAGMILPEKPDTIILNTAQSTVHLPTLFWKTPYNFVVTPAQEVKRQNPWLELRRMPERTTGNPEFFLLCKTAYPAIAWIKSDTVKVYKTGIFFNKLILSEGTNRVQVGIVNEDSSSTTYVEEFTYKKTNNIRNPFPLWIDEKSLEPNIDLTLTPDDRIHISFIGSRGQKGFVKITPGKREIVCSRKDFEDYSLYEAKISLKPMDFSREYTIKVALQSAEKIKSKDTHEIEIKNSITINDLDNFPYVRIIEDHTRLTYNLGQVRLGGPIRAEYPPGIILKTSGVLGDYFRIQLNTVEEGYLNMENVEVMPPTYTRQPYYITSLYCAPSDTADVLTIPYSEPIPYAIYPEPDQRRIRIRLYGAKTSSTWITHRQGRKYIDNVTWSQPTPDTYEVSVNLSSSKIWGYDLRNEGNNLVFQIKYPPEVLIENNKPLTGLKIAIEAGHGGDSYGALGLSGLLEKDINLDLARKLGALLGSYGADILQVREVDTTMYLLTKRDKARYSDADMLISIHANAAGTNDGYLRVGGTSTYYHNPFWAKLAEKIYDHLLELDIDEFGVIGSFNYTVIRVSQMPSILVEQAFMTHAEDEEKLATDQFRQEMAQKIYEGIIDYLVFMKNEQP